MVALEAILASEKFVAAPQMSAFLRYVVEQAASGNKFRIKAYTVAVDALGKPDTFDPQNDPVVRVLAGRLRTSLRVYYEQRPDEDVVIQMKPGSYVPVFVMKDDDSSHKDAGDSEVLDEEDEDSDHSATAANGIIDESDLAASNDLSSSLQAVADDDQGLIDSGLSDQQTASDLGRLVRRFPIASLAAAVLLAFLVGTLVNGEAPSREPIMQAASLAHSSTSLDYSPQRARPDTLSLFISALDTTDTLVSQLSTMMIGVFSESEDVRVYRMMRSTQRQQFWPEDYLLSINVLPLPQETQISVQLLDAQTGRITHVENLHLSTSATEQLNAAEMKTIIDCANYLISSDGPLHTDYQTKIDS